MTDNSNTPLVAPDGEEQPVYVLQRHPYPDKGHTYYNIWVKDGAMKLSSAGLSKLLADTLQNQVRVTDLATNDPKGASDVQ